MALAELSPTAVSRPSLVPLPNSDGDSGVVWLRGEHDRSTLTALWETMARAIAYNDTDVIVDLSGVEFMDASTVSAIVRAQDLLHAQSRSLALRSPSARAARVLDLCGLTLPAA